MLDPRLVERICCPNCRGDLIVDSEEIRCSNCGNLYRIEGTVPVFLESNSKNLTESGFDYVTHYVLDSEKFDYFEERHGATKHSERRIREYTMSLIPKGTKSVLDAGCGSTWVAKALQHSKIFHVSLDISTVNPQKALELYPSPDHVGIVADSYHLPFRNNSFDCVIAAEIIEHLDKPAEFTEELLRVVKPGGVLIVTTPYRERLAYELCIHCHQLTPHNAHLHSWDEQKLREQFPSNAKWEFYTMNNKLLVFLRTYPFLQWMPFALWKSVDRAANYLFPRPVNCIVRAGK